MNKKYSIVLTFIFLFNIVFPFNILIAKDVYDPLSGGWLEEQDGVNILHVSGSYYEMGYQHGYLLKNEILENIRCRNDTLSRHGWPIEKRKDVWNIQKQYLPQEYLEEINGMADGSGLSIDEIAVHNMWIGVFNLMSCWGAAIWGDATVDGTLYHMRSCDGSFDVKDPLSGKTLNENTFLMVRQPDNAYDSLYPFYAGDIVCIGGFNEKGVAVGELTIHCSDTQFHGINSGFRMRMVLDNADDIYDAREIMNANRTCGWNFIISDGNIPTGFAIEQSANYVYTGAWFDPTESMIPFWEIKDVVRRGNCYIHPILAKNERKNYDCSGIKGFFQWMFKKDIYFVPWTQYKAISEEIEQQYGSLTLEKTMMLFREVYSGHTNLIFRFMQNHDYYASRHLWVACPKSGDMAICFGDDVKKSYENPIHYFNLFELMNSEPPPSLI